MTIRRFKGNFKVSQGLVVATAQAIAEQDMVAMVSSTLVRASDTTWASAVATPSAPTVANGGTAVGSGLANSLTGVKVSANFPWGEGALSAAATATPTLASTLKITLAALPTGATSWNVFIESAAGNATYLLYETVYTGGAVIYATGYGTGRVPAASAVLTDATTMTQYNFSRYFIGISNQRKVANVARPFGNSEDNRMIVCQGGVYECDCASASFDVGDYVGPAKDTGNTLMDQTVIEVAHESLAVGRVVQAGTSVTKVLVEMYGKFAGDLFGLS